MTASGKLRHRISIERRLDELDDVGQPVDTWENVLHAAASIEDRRGREYTEGGQALVNEVTTDIRIRYREGIYTEMRVIDVCSHGRCAGQTYNITNVRDQSGRLRDLLLECQRVRVLTGAPF